MLAEDACKPVNRNEAAEDQARPLQRAEPDHHGENRKQQNAFKSSLIKLAWMARQRPAIGKDHRPGQAGVGRASPQFAVDEVGEPSEEQADRPDRGRDIAEGEDRKVVLPAEQDHRGDAAEKAAVKRHAALPQFEDLRRMLDEEFEIVEQHIAGAAAEDDTEGDPEDEVVELRQRDRRRPAPQLLVPEQRACVDPTQDDAADVGQRIPADCDRPDRNRDRVEDGKGDQEKGHYAFWSLRRLRR